VPVGVAQGPAGINFAIRTVAALHWEGCSGSAPTAAEATAPVEARWSKHIAPIVRHPLRARTGSARSAPLPLRVQRSHQAKTLSTAMNMSQSVQFNWLRDISGRFTGAGGGGRVGRVSGGADVVVVIGTLGGGA
jgi:hypothetical protein